MASTNTVLSSHDIIPVLASFIDSLCQYDSCEHKKTNIGKYIKSYQKV